MVGDQVAKCLKSGQCIDGGGSMIQNFMIPICSMRWRMLLLIRLPILVFGKGVLMNQQVRNKNNMLY